MSQLSSNDFLTNQTETGHLNHHDINAALSSTCLLNTSYSNNQDYSKQVHNFSSHGTPFTVVGINAQSLQAHFSQLETFMDSTNNLPDIIAVTETWIEDGTESIYNLNDYNCVGNNKGKKTNDHGGILLYILKFFEFSVRHDLEFACSRYTAQSLFVEIDSEHEKKIIIGSIYRPPGGSIDDFEQHLRSTLQKACRSKQLVYLVGDFNLNLLNFSNDVPVANFLDLIQSYGFIPAITIPTRVTHHSATLIDNIFCNNIADPFISSVLTEPISDHLITAHTTFFPDENQHSDYTQRTYRKFTEKSLKAFEHELMQTSLLPDKFIDVSLTYSYFSTKFKALYDKHFPLKTHKQNTKYKKNPWITDEIIKSCMRKAKLYKDFLNNPTTENDRAYRDFNRIHCKTLKLAKQKYIESKLNSASNNIRSTWKILNNLLGRVTTKNNIKSLKSKNENITNPSEIAEIFNKHFASVGAKLDAAIPAVNGVKDYYSESTNQSLFFGPCDTSEIISVISKLPNSTAVGYDDISTIVVKKVAHVIAPALTQIVNFSLTSGQMPDELKIAKIVPVHKDGATNEVNNYRPISILPVCSKIFERITYDRLNSFLEKNNILCSQQYGFRNGKNTEDATLKFSQDVIHGFEQKLFTIAVFIDLRKAFDTVCHDRLLDKLYHYGIRGVAHKWFTSYLQNREQYVQANDHSSLHTKVTYGVPQGSILGPLLFLIYINELPKISPLLSAILFADDTTFYISGKDLDTLCHTLNIELKKIYDWLCLNRLSLNVEKTSFIVFRVRQKPLNTNVQIHIDTEKLTEASSVKFLGLKLDPHLSWNQHVQFIANKVSKGTGMLHKLRDYLPSGCLRKLYYAFVYPHLSYCSLAWMNTSKSNRLRLLRLQKKALRSIFHKPAREHSLPLFKAAGILPIDELIYYRGGLWLFKHKNKNCFLKYKFTVHSHNTRTSRNCHTNYHRTEVSKLSFIGRAGKIWDSIPEDIKLACSLGVFKKRLLSLLVERVKMPS